MIADQIALCSIYRNEERLLPQFLERHDQLFGELILVDTGSSDRSATLVKEMGHQHHLFPWTGSFSDARNHSLSLATRPFILVLDIDEILRVEELRDIVDLLADEEVDGLSLCQINLGLAPDLPSWRSSAHLPQPFCELAAGYTSSRLIRVFRNDPRVRFRGTLHETVGDTLHESGYHSRITDIPFYHLGWIEAGRSQAEQEEKMNRYKTVIEQEYRHSPSAQNGYYLLTTLESAQERLRVAYDLVKHHPQYKDFWIVLARSAAELGQWTRALEYARRGQQSFPHSSTLRLIEIRALNQCGQPQAALETCNKFAASLLDHPNFRFERLRAMIMMGQKEEAQSELDRFGPEMPRDLRQALLGILLP